MTNQNFTLKLTLDEANAIRDALKARLEDLLVHGIPVPDKHLAGRIDTMLRRDFGSV